MALCSSLDTDHGEIDAFLCQQLLVCAMLLDSAILKHHYQVCVLDGGQPVSDHDAGAAFSGFVQGFLDNLFTFRVQSRGSFIQKQDARLPNKGASYGNALFLATRELSSFVPYSGVVFL